MEKELITNTTTEALTTNVFARELPDLSKATPAPLELTGDYWTPETVGEKKRLFFKELNTEMAVDQKTGEDIELLVVYFVEVMDGKKKVIRQASKRLTGVFESFAATIKPGMAFEITYLGKKKNKQNSYLSDTWSVLPLAV